MASLSQSSLSLSWVREDRARRSGRVQGPRHGLPFVVSQEASVAPPRPNSSFPYLGSERPWFPGVIACEIFHNQAGSMSR